jgi:hypothetical protein
MGICRTAPHLSMSATADAVDDPAPVPAQPEPEKDEPVEPIRMMPAPAQNAAVDADAVQEVKDDVADVEPEPIELPPVADVVAEAARELAIQVWGSGLISRAQLPPSLDQRLANAQAMGWLAVNDQVIARSGVDPRPVTVTRIPNF